MMGQSTGAITSIVILERSEGSVLQLSRKPILGERFFAYAQNDVVSIEGVA